MQTIPFNEVKNNLIGQPGTDRRDAYEAKLAKETGPTMKGILFSTPMVAATNEDRKTMTRREMKIQPSSTKSLLLIDNTIPVWYYQFAKDDFMRDGSMQHGEADSIAFTSQYQPGDILYVREEHLVTRGAFNDWIVDYKDGTTIIFEEADLPADTIKRLSARKTLGKWQRGRFLPKALARTFLRVTAVKAERIQDISQADAIAEGIEMLLGESGWSGWKDYIGHKSGASCSNAVSSFQTLWKSINGPDSWNANPYVFAYTFQRTDAPHSILQSSNPSIL